MSVQQVFEWLRDSRRDRAVAQQLAAAEARRTLRRATAPHDAFVKHARAVREGVVVGSARSSAGDRVTIRLPVAGLIPHALVQGGTGVGKSTWIASLLTQYLAAGQPAGIVDAKGDLYDFMIRHVGRVAGGLNPEDREAFRQRVVVVNPFADALVPLNICHVLPGSSPEAIAYSMTLALSRLFDSALGPHMQNILRHTLLLLAESDLTLAEAPLILQDDVLRGVLVHRAPNLAVREFFLSVYPSMSRLSKEALISRLQGLLLSENVRLMLGADTLVDLRDVFDQGKLLLAFFGKGANVPEEQVEVLGSIFLQTLFTAAYARGTGQQRSYALVCDEFFHLLDAPGLVHRFTTGLASLRAFGLALTLVMHNFLQVPAALREGILANCDRMALFRTSSRNAEFFGDFLPEVDPRLVTEAWREGRQRLGREETRRHQLEALQRLPTRHFFWYDRHQPYRAVEVRAPLVRALDAAPLTFVNATSDGWLHGGAAVPRDLLRRQIELRRARLREMASARPAPRTGARRAATTNRDRPSLG